MDTAMETLRCRGVRSAMINADGQIRVIGNRSGRPWRVPVPRASGSGVVGIVDLGGDGALFSASAEQGAFRHDGRRYHNVIDPRTGRPARGARAASVLHLGDATTAAAAARALMVAGVEDWRAVAKRMGIRHAMLIAPDGTLHLTPAMAARLELLDRNLEVAASAGNDSATPDKPLR
jgi:thiamine biosynthesis lipoprotein